MARGAALETDAPRVGDAQSSATSAGGAAVIRVGCSCLGRI